MSEGRPGATAAARVGTGAGRLLRAWRSLPPERRLAAGAAIGLFLTLFLPWYQRQFFIVIAGKAAQAADSQTGWAAFSWVEAAVLVVAVGVLTLLFQRAEGRAFHVPGGDGGVITVAGFWTCVLVIWRIFDKQGGSAAGQTVVSTGIEWGIFVALAVAALLAYSGLRIRAAHSPEPPLPGESPGAAPAPAAPAPAAPAPAPAAPAPAAPAPAQSPRVADPDPHEARTVSGQPGGNEDDRDDPAPTLRFDSRAEEQLTIPLDDQPD